MKTKMDVDDLKNWYKISERIQYFQEKRNLSSRQLSLNLGKSEGYISKLMSRDFNMPITTLLEILDCLDVSMEEFFSDNFRTYKSDNEIYSLIKNMNEESKQGVLTIIKNMKTK